MKKKQKGVGGPDESPPPPPPPSPDPVYSPRPSLRERIVCEGDNLSKRVLKFDRKYIIFYLKCAPATTLKSNFLLIVWNCSFSPRYTRTEIGTFRPYVTKNTFFNYRLVTSSYHKPVFLFRIFLYL